jgi:hypothetical protein
MAMESLFPTKMNRNRTKVLLTYVKEWSTMYIVKHNNPKHPSILHDRDWETMIPLPCYKE